MLLRIWCSSLNGIYWLYGWFFRQGSHKSHANKRNEEINCTIAKSTSCYQNEKNITIAKMDNFARTWDAIWKCLPVEYNIVSVGLWRCHERVLSRLDSVYFSIVYRFLHDAWPTGFFNRHVNQFIKSIPVVRNADRTVHDRLIIVMIHTVVISTTYKRTGVVFFLFKLKHSSHIWFTTFTLIYLLCVHAIICWCAIQTCTMFIHCCISRVNLLNL